MWTPPKIESWSDEELEAIVETMTSELVGYPAPNAEQFRIEWLGRKNGRLTIAREAWFAQADTPERKKKVGQIFNEIKQEVLNHIASHEGIDLGETHTSADSSAPAV